MECFIIVTVLWVFSVCLHEFGHALVAYWGGDHTVKDKGYLTMNPIHYTHPVYSILMPVVFMVLGGIGLPGGAVYIERHRLRSKAWNTWVSLAGPAMQLPVILPIALAFKLGWLQNDPQSLASVSLGFLLQIEVGSLLLNLLPVPPLDGFQAIAPWLPDELREKLYAVSSQGMGIVFLAFWFVQPLNDAFWHAVYAISNVLGVDAYTGYIGFKTFRFWTH